MSAATRGSWTWPVERAFLWALAAPFAARTRVPPLIPGTPPVLMDGVGLTFDDGPDHHTPYFLEVLESYGIKATFFVVGEQVERSPEVLRRIVTAGHEVGVHCYRHLPYPRRHDTDAMDDLVRAYSIVEEAGGGRPQIFRPPYGLFSRAVSREARRLDLEKVLWSRAGLDWGSRATPESVARNISEPEPGEIMLLHDSEAYGAPGSHRCTLQALPTIIETIRREALGFYTVSELLDHGRGDRSVFGMNDVPGQ